MAKEIIISFPLRRCSWAYQPVVSAISTRRMLQSLEAVCVAQVIATHGADRFRVARVGKGALHGA